MAKSEKRIKIGMKCEACAERNYSTTKNKQNSTSKLNLKKYCPRCRKHTLHKEAK